jgi:hypothetical protein
MVCTMAALSPFLFPSLMAIKFMPYTSYTRISCHGSREKMTLDEALEMIRRRRPTAQPIPAFLELLKSIEEVQEKTDTIGCDVPGNETRAEVAEVDKKEGSVSRHSQPLNSEAECKQLVDAAASQAIDTKEAGTLDEAMPKRRRIIGPSRRP